MKAHIENSITIKASIESVWIVLSDFNKYPDWSPTIKQFFSIPSAGQRSKVRLEQSKGQYDYESSVSKHYSFEGTSLEG
ncbi:SRPBCC family protein [Sphingobacterium faecium]|uniref:SRPBCC family protein n=1 Tax=Sphingobacterium faecium TaxID=34087 RepID=UPI00320AD532